MTTLFFLLHILQSIEKKRCKYIMNTESLCTRIWRIYMILAPSGTYIILTGTSQYTHDWSASNRYIGIASREVFVKLNVCLGKTAYLTGPAKPL